MNSPRCLVVEDEDLLAELLLDNLRQAGFAAARAADGERALADLSAQSFDLVILDVMLPLRDGFAVLAELRARQDDTPVLVLSARAADQDRIRGLALRADDYLTKPFNLEELLLRCHALLRRGRARPRALLAFGGNRIDLSARRAHTWRGEDVALTPAEVSLLRLLASRPGEVVDRRAIVDTVFGRSTTSKHRTVDNLVLRLRRLFEHDSKQPVHLHTVRAVGLRFDL
jgi:two-component system alkaline phosphatase synthesis response regulator PhoP